MKEFITRLAAVAKSKKKRGRKHSESSQSSRCRPNQRTHEIHHQGYPSHRENKMYKHRIFKLLSALAVAIGPLVAQAQVPSTPASGAAAVSAQKPVVYDKYQDAAADANGQLPSIDRRSNAYAGYSMLPFGSRNKAIDEALGNAAKLGGAKTAGASLLVIADGQQLFSASAAPPGSLMGGTFWVYRVIPIRFVPLTSENLLAEIKAHATSHPLEGRANFLAPHMKLLAEIARDPAYGSLTSEYRAIIRAANDEHIDGYAMASLIGLLDLHEGKGCTEDLLRWAKHHKNSQVRLASYRALISQGKHSEVEEILKSEENKAIKEAVGKELI